MPFTRSRYPADWPAISQRIRERAEQRCEQCRAPNHTVIVRGEGLCAGMYMLPDGHVHHEVTGAFCGMARGSEWDGRAVRVILTVAHLDHNEDNNADANLRALCQRCHFAHDRQDNARRRWAKSAVGTLPGVKP